MTPEAIFAGVMAGLLSAAALDLGIAFIFRASREAGGVDDTR